MRGLASARAAVSIVNALPLGVGAAIGIDWPARVVARLDRGSEPGARPTVEPRGAGTAVVRASAQEALRSFGPPAPGGLRLIVRSSIPVARGLKSSSAVASAVVLATARASGADPGPIEVARLSARVGRSTGVSATGAFDDAVAGLEAGGVVTDNRRDVVLRRLEVDPELGVALWIPGRHHPRPPTVRRRFARNRSLARRAVDLALDGDWVGAMRANSSVVEAAMGYRYDRLHACAARGGAVASGVSGLGPAFAALAPSRKLGRLLREFPESGVRCTRSLFHTSPGGGRRGGP